MNKKELKTLRITALTLTFSIVALAISVYSGLHAYQFKANVLGSVETEDQFNAKVEKGIEAFIKKQEEEYKQKNTPPPPSNEPVEVSMDDDAIKGDKNAPITIVEFSDYECPFCGRFFEQAMPQIQEKYIDTGKVKYVFRDFPLGFHQRAIPASVAAECIREKGGDNAYWNYHDVLFKNQKALSDDDLKKYAFDLGYDVTNCLEENKYADEVDKDMKEGASYGVTGTPAFFINGRKIVGAQPFSAFEAIIEEELAK